MTTAVSSNSAATSATATSSTPTGFAALGAGDFIKMLAAQLQNQDPSQPTDNTAMVAQLAQFTSLSATTSMGSTLTQISGQLGTMIGELGQALGVSGASTTANSTSSTTSAPTTAA